MGLARVEDGRIAFEHVTFDPLDPPDASPPAEAATL
jgi:hypothetical protein